jgi:purine-binding chemotaxis protein CheW
MNDRRSDIQGGTTHADIELVGLGGKYLTFKLSQEEYGLQILKVREIIALMGITPVPRSPAFIEGVINLRGRIIPVVNLRKKFGMEKVGSTDRTCIIVVDLSIGDRTLPMGILVDNVCAVLDIRGEDIEPPPEYSATTRSDFILGIGKVDNSVKILLDIEKVLSGDELCEVTDIHQASNLAAHLAEGAEPKKAAK